MNSESCDTEVYKHGTHVFTLADVPSTDIDLWCEKLSNESGHKVDWHFAGGRACIRCLGNASEVINAIQKNILDISNKTKYWRFTTENDSVLPV